MTDQNEGSRAQPPVTITIDGVEYTVQDRRQTAASLLGIAGVDPSDHDLARVVGKGEVKKFEDEEEIQVTPGAKYVSLFVGSTPVV